LHHQYFFASVDEGRGLDHGENYEEDITVGVSEGSEAIVLFLACSIPESEIDHTSVDLDSRGVVVKDSRDVFGGELVLRVAK
jgi:hypothetical protein